VTGFGAPPELVATTGDSTNDHKVVNTQGSRIMVIVDNTDASVHNVTVKAVVQPVHADDVVLAAAAGKKYVLGPYPAELFSQPNGVDQGCVQIDLDTATGMKFYAIAF